VVLLEHPQRAAEIVSARAEAELDRVALEPVMEGRGVVRSGAFVEQARRHVGDARFVGGILVGAASGGELERDHRHCRVVHQPSLDATGADHLLDGHRACGRDKRCGNDGGQRDDGAVYAGGGVHERFSSWRVSLIR
jgi:hypothetical protein